MNELYFKPLLSRLDRLITAIENLDPRVRARQDDAAMDAFVSSQPDVQHPPHIELSGVGQEAKRHDRREPGSRPLTADERSELERIQQDMHTQPQPLTEADVRRIIGEERAEWQQQRNAHHRSLVTQALEQSARPARGADDNV